MIALKHLVLICLFIAIGADLHAQSINCPPNLDFEYGNFTNWKLYTGTPPTGGCCPINTPTLSGPTLFRHTITSGAGTDLYGGFPVVAPGGGVYSLQLGNMYGGAEAERARYYVHIPSGVNNYSVIFRYAVVFENPNHIPAEQPRFEVKAYDSITNTVIPCTHFTYISSSNIPGFTRSTIDTMVYYKSWTTASINLSGYAGRTVAVDFASGDCAQGGHFGYGYVDMNCGLFQISGVVCSSTPTTTLTAPPGFAKYYWKDSSLTTTIDSGQTAVIPTPSVTTKYAVILVPYTGFGCPDTLYTTVSVSNITLNGTKDTAICKGSSLQLAAGASGTGTGPLTYSWAPASGLSCTTCSNPIATPSANSTYYLTVTDTNNCSKKDTVTIQVDSFNLSLSVQNVPCAGGNNGSVTANTNLGMPPFTYSWNTTPVQTTPTVSSLPAGTYIVTVKDSLGCSKTDTGTIIQIGNTLSSTKSKINVSCANGNNGSATVTPSGGTPPYTYSWNTTPVKTTATITNLNAGTYIVTITDSLGCSKNDTVIITQPAAITSVKSATNVSCFGGTNGTATINPAGGTIPYTYSWNTTPVKTTATANNLPAGTYTVTITDSMGCIKHDTVTVTQSPLLNTSKNKTNVSCYGSNNGTATVVPSGGTQPYTYSWNTTPVKTTATITNLTAGTYTVIVTDSMGCTKNDTVTILQPTAIATTKSKTDLSCIGANNGTASVIPSGGTQPYTYSWNTTPVQTTGTANNLPAGPHVVITTDSMGCTKTDTVTVSILPAIQTTQSKTNVNCHGGNNGAATIVSTGGTPPYNYSWNTTPAQTAPTATNLSAGTYILTITDSLGCSRNDTITITQPPVLNTVKNKTNISCHGDSNGSAAVVASGGTTPYSYTWNTSPVQTTAIATNLAAGTYIVTIIDSFGCNRNDTVIITQPSALVTNTIQNNVHCYGNNNGQATVLPARGTMPYTYSWNTTPVQYSATANNLAAGMYIAIVTDSMGCVKKDTVIITQPPVLNTTSNITNVNCFSGSNGTATVLPTGGQLPYTYSWNTTPIQTSATATNLMAGSYLVTITDSFGCTKYDTVTITQPAIINTTRNKTDVHCYGGNNGFAGVSPSGGTSPYTFSWNTTPVQTTATIANLTAGIYIVAVTDSLGCIKKDTFNITQPALLNTTEMTTNVSCFGGNNGTAKVFPSGGTAPYTYYWSTIPVQTTPAVINLSSGTYAVTVTDSFGCTKTDTVIITQPTALATSKTKTDALCSKDSNGMASITVSGGIAPYTYQWNTIPVKTTAAIGNLPAGTYIVNITDNKGCLKKDTIVIIEPSAITLSKIKKNVSCAGDSSGSIMLQVTGGTKPYLFQWNTTPMQNTASITNLTAGFYTVYITDSNGCTTTTTDTITQPAILKLNTLAIKSTCPEAADGVARALVSGGKAPYVFTWNTTPAQNNDTAFYLKAGQYFITVTDANDCKISDSVTINSFPELAIDAGHDEAICLGDSIKLTVTGALKYTWFPPTALSCTTCKSPIAKPLSTITYTVTGVDSNNCHDTDLVKVNITPRLEVSVGPDINVCIGDAAQLHASGGVSYTWFPKEELDNSFIADPVSVVDSSIKYQVIIRENECFTDTLYQMVHAHQRPTVELGPDMEGIPGAVFKLHADTTNATSISWSPTTGLSCADCINPMARVTNTTTYTVVVSNNDICFAQDAITIKVACDDALVFIPNTFTPNGDGYNDYFYISSKGINVVDVLRVYSRWGELLFEARNIPPNEEANGWNGTYKLQKLPPDVFVYYCEIQCAGGDKIFLKGDISLIR